MILFFLYTEKIMNWKRVSISTKRTHLLRWGIQFNGFGILTSHAPVVCSLFQSKRDESNDNILLLCVADLTQLKISIPRKKTWTSCEKMEWKLQHTTCPMICLCISKARVFSMAWTWLCTVYVNVRRTVTFWFWQWTWTLTTGVYWSQQTKMQLFCITWQLRARRQPFFSITSP